MRTRAILLALAVTVVATACSERQFDGDKVRGFIDATTPLAFRFSYTVTAGEDTVTVRGILEDDFRYKLQLALDGEPAAEQVVVDDGVALRFFEPGIIDAFTDRLVEGQVDLETDVEGADVFDALAAGRWVLDEAGAPNAQLTTLDRGADTDADFDPMFDARTALEYVRRIAEAPRSFREYDAESLDPTYRRDEDPFPVPAESSGVRRFDSVIEGLPSAAAATTGNRTLPTTRNFRKLAVYVEDGRIIAVREFIGVTPRQLEELLDYGVALLEATGGEEVLAAFRERADALADEPEALADFLIGGLNTFIQSIGSQPIRFRTMALELSDFDAVSARVALPEDVVRGDLAVIRNLGRKPIAANASGEASS